MQERLRPLFWLWMVVCLAGMAAAQGAKVRPELDGDESDRDHPQERQAWFREGRSVPGQSAAQLLERGYLQKLRLRALRRGLAANASAIANLPNWQNLGPNPLNSDPTGVQSYGAVSGRTTSVAIDQNDPSGNTVYIGGAYGGVWRSTNATAAPEAVMWTPLTDNQPTLAVGAIALKPDTTGASTVILVGTGEPDASGDSYYGLGILRSADSGATWQLIGADTLGHSFKGLGFTRIAFNPGNPSQVIAAASNATNGSRVGANGGLPSTIASLYYSSDAGQSWILALVTDDGANAITPSSATDVAYDPAYGKFYAMIRRHGMYSSADGGKTWQRMAQQPGPGLAAGSCPANINLNCPLFRGHIAVQPANGDVYVAYMATDSAGNETLQGVFRSGDGGASWSGDLGQSGYSSCGDNAGCGASQSVYNFYLNAVPRGAGTDLYMGGVNVFRCSLSSSTAAPCKWTNLTHVYGCSPIGAPSHVHPDQHGMAYVAANPQIMYFVTDGGVYRSLSGAAADGTCNAGNANAWQNLNGTLGSMGEFIWFSHDPNNEATVLGGTQDNGSPALINGQWAAVNSGDGGYNDIDPSDGSIWYTSNFFLSVQRCTAGAGCDTPAFTDAVTNQKAAGDNSSFYPPYMLDPRDSHKLIAGTCRVWRGAADGSGWPGANNANALSFKLDSGTNALCSTADVMISALAAGGPPAASGASSVIYAGRDDGRIFVSTAAESGQNSFVDRTAGLAANGYKISSIALDANDPSGNTAVVAVMGFGVAHVWRTSNAGVSWSNISSSLPDAPADAVAIDPVDPYHIFVGMDVGIFETHDAGISWSEAGAGLPNVPVTRLLFYDGPGTRLLRASTYGRGIWELPQPAVPFFSLQMAPGAVSSVSEAAGQPATYNLALSSMNGFAGLVTLSCSGASSGLSCSASPSSVNLVSGSTNVPVTITVSAPQNGRAFPWLPGITLLGLGWLVKELCRKTRRVLRPAWILAPIFLMILAICSCGGGGGASTQSATRAPVTAPAGSTLIVTATSGHQTRSLSLTMNVR